MASSTIKSMFSDMFVFKEFTKAYTLSAYGEYPLAINIHLNGYIPFAIRAFSSDNKHVSVYATTISDGEKAYINVKNMESTSQSGTAFIRIAFVKAPVTEMT